MHFIPCACVLLAVLLGTVRCDGPLDRINAIIDDVIRRTDNIVLGTEAVVLNDLDRTQALIRRRTVRTPVRGNIAAVNALNRQATEALLQRTVRRILDAENEFGAVYRRAVADIRDQVAGSPLEPFIYSALQRIDQIVNRAILRINQLALDARARITWQTNVTAAFLQELHDRAVLASPPDDERYQRLLVERIDRVQPEIRGTLVEAKSDINEEVRNAEDRVRREADPQWALAHNGQDVDDE